MLQVPVGSLVMDAQEELIVVPQLNGTTAASSPNHDSADPGC